GTSSFPSRSVILVARSGTLHPFTDCACGPVGPALGRVSSMVAQYLTLAHFASVRRHRASCATNAAHVPPWTGSGRDGRLGAVDKRPRSTFRIPGWRRPVPASRGRAALAILATFAILGSGVALV